MQQLFNDDVFKVTAEICDAEGLGQSALILPSNDMLLELFEKPPLGLFPVCP